MTIWRVTALLVALLATSSGRMSASEPEKGPIQTPDSAEWWWKMFESSVDRENLRLKTVGVRIEYEPDRLHKYAPPRRITLVADKCTISEKTLTEIDRIKIDNVCFAKFSGCKIETDSSILKSYSHCLVELSVEECELPADFFRGIENLSQLNYLYLKKCKLHEKAGKLLAAIKKIDTLDLTDCDISEDHMKNINEIEVRNLILSNNPVNDESIKVLNNSTVSNLDISRTAITKNCYSDLLSMKSLKKLTLSKGILTADQIEKIEKNEVRVVVR